MDLDLIHANPILLRPWKDSDLEPLISMNADVEVMRFFPRPLTAEESQLAFQRFQQSLDQKGWGLWVVEVEGEFAGFTGLSEPKFSTHFTPCVEIGWRLRREYWGRGIAFAAAQQAVEYGFSILHLQELVSFTAVTNVRSRKLMERLGFSHNVRDDFRHPALDENHPMPACSLPEKGLTSGGPYGILRH